MKSITTAVIGALLGAGHLFAAPSGKPNVLYIVADDLGYGDLGVHGCKDIPTPNLDALAGEGVQFTNGYVTGTVCSPTRCALMTGRYQQRDGVNDWVRPGSDFGMAVGVPTIADYLKKAGYRTAIVGKWHLGEKDGFHPLSRGFDDFYGFLGGGRPYYPADGVTPSSRLLDGRKPVEEEPAYTTFGFGDKAVDLIKGAKASNQPFFIYLSFNAVHTPMHPPKDSNRFDDIADKGRRAYAGMLFAMDESIGRVLDTLRKEGLEDNTLVYFISDNGGPITRNAPNSSQNGPLRGGKGETWEGGIRVPFFLKWPGHLKAGEKYEPMVSQMDVTATVLALAGLEPDAKYPTDGVDLMPYLTGAEKGDPRSSLSWKAADQWAIREGKWKLTNAKTSKKAKAPILGLYDLSKDIGERHDLSAQFPEQVEKLQVNWAAWRKEVEGDRLPDSDSANKKKQRKLKKDGAGK